MPKKVFDKPALTIDEQILKLKNRRLIFLDEAYARKKLLELNYYRLEGYWLPLETDHADPNFIENAQFETIIRWYDCDTELRSILFDAISVIEVSFRTKYAYFMSTIYGPFSYLDPDYSHDKNKWKTSIDKVCSDILRSSEPFIEHFIETYEEFFPPIWAAVEVLSFGSLSHLYSLLNNKSPITLSDKTSAKDAIAKSYDLDCHLLQSWAQAINLLRNLSAHQSRLMFSYFKSQPLKPKNKDNLLLQYWYTPIKTTENIKLIIKNNCSIKTICNNCIDYTKMHIGELQTGSLVYLPKESSLENSDKKTIALPDDTSLLLPIGKQISINQKKEILLPPGTLLNVSTNTQIDDYFGKTANTSFYNVILIICYFYKNITNSNTIKDKIKTLLLSHKEYALMLGFPTDWYKVDFW